jgi:adenine-specific DNA-methyltransferase
VLYELWKGENLHVLTAIQKRRGTYQLCYLDPPYNTRRPLEYHDSIGKKGTHAEWTAYLRARLELVCDLLSDDGIVAISIDSRELAHLQILCDEIFGEENRFANIVQRVKAPAGLAGGVLMDVVEYLLVYTKDRTTWSGRSLTRSEELRALGEYRRRITDISTGTVVGGDDGVLVREHDFTLSAVDDAVLSTGDLAGVFCTTNSQGVSNLLRHVPATGLYSVEHTPGRGTYAGQTRTRWFYNHRLVLWLDDVATVVDGRVMRRVRETTLWDDHWYQRLGAEGGVSFRGGKKPIAMLQRILGWFPDDICVLDPFAGSASMLHAVAALNTTDGGSRRCSSITNDENNICTAVAWPRVGGVLTGALPDGRRTSALSGTAVLRALPDIDGSPATTSL